MSFATITIAHTAHEANRVLQRDLGDPISPEWMDAPESQRRSAIEGVRAIRSGNVTGPEQSHESWLAQKERDGWVRGPVKDEGLKTHPLMVPFADLPLAQQAKDKLFFAIVTALL